MGKVDRILEAGALDSGKGAAAAAAMMDGEG